VADDPGGETPPTAAHLKQTVVRWVKEVINRGNFAVLEELCTPEAARDVGAWVRPFRDSFPDVHMEVVELVAEGNVVVGRFTCSATHFGRWLGHPPTRGPRPRPLSEATTGAGQPPHVDILAG
jgi:hypothetical protein